MNWQMRSAVRVSWRSLQIRFIRIARNAAGRPNEPRGSQAQTEHRADAGESALWRADPLRRALPVSCSSGKEKVPHAWRSEGLRRAAG